MSLRTSLIIDLAGNLATRARQYARELGGLSAAGQRHMRALSGVAASAGRGIDAMGNRYTAAIAGAGLAYKAARSMMDSASLDKRLTRVTRTAGESKEAAAALRAELHVMSRQTGKSVDELREGFYGLIQSGQSWDTAVASIKAINDAAAVTGAQMDALQAGMTVAGQSFGFDLSNLRTAKLVLDQMTKAGDLGNAELEDLSDIFARVGGDAKRAGFSFAGTLGLIERMSLVERNRERLATLAGSTLRVFTNQTYLKKAAQVTGVKFYDAKGERRAAFDVLDDIAAKYKKLGSAQAKDRAMDAAFGDTDLDTRRGLAMLFEGDALAEARRFSSEIEGAAGTVDKGLSDALNNAEDQVARLKAALGEAADGLAQPVNKVIQDAIKYVLDERKLTGTDLLVGGTLAGLAGFGALKLGGKALSRMGGSVLSGMAGGMAKMPLPLPVYVVNSQMSLLPGQLGGAPTPQAGGAGRGGRGAGGAAPARGGRWAKLAGRATAVASAVPMIVEGAQVLMDDTATKQQKGEAVGAAAGGAAGGWGGAVLGAAIGTAILPGIGTAIGGALGSALAAWGGSELGRWLGGKVTGEPDDPRTGKPAGADSTTRVLVEVKGNADASVTSHSGPADVDVYSGMGMGSMWE